MNKVALITTHAPSLVHFRGQLIESLRTLEIEVFAIAPNHNADTRKWLIEQGAVPVDCLLSRTGLNPFFDTLSVISLFKILRLLRPDAVFSYFIKPVIFGTIAARFAGVPRRIAMIEGLGFVFTETGRKNSVRTKALKIFVVFLYRIALRFSHQVIFLNNDDAIEFLKLRILKKDKIFQLGGIGVDLRKWRHCKPATDQITFILVARLLREKGVDYYAKAAREIKREYCDVRFVLLGDLDENPGSIALQDVEAWVAEGILEWPGHVPVMPFLENSSVFVLPSYYREGVPLSVQEALATGRAVITTDSPGCRETVVDGVNGFLVPTHDVPQLVEKMKIFIRQPSLISSMGEKSRELAVENFDIEKKTLSLVEVILK